jgi:hypothetical protein
LGKGFKIGGAIGLVSLIAFLAFKAYEFRQKNIELEWLLFAKQAEVDTLKVIAEYSVPETVIVSRIRVIHDTTEGHITVDTVYEDIPKIYGSIKIDTTRDFGPGSNPLKVRVAGEFWYPPEYSHRNWMLIHPIIGEKVPQMPVTKSQKSVGIGLNYLRSFNQHDYFGVSVRYKRFTLIGSYDFWRKSLISGISMELFTF